ncbi:Ribosome biogenesis regulatory protein [Intoshia linei]|uniref:Ribosome biogenesis regulatory protein n=1 Tax=Intoshia linei TaxID=1819745 RepID=A0A177BBE7_9BILA|nr:Ribosome biogenesis regulatory protein [Intoshia linei]
MINIENSEFGEIIDSSRVVLTNDEILNKEKMNKNRSEYLDSMAHTLIGKLFSSLNKLKSVDEIGRIKKTENPLILLPREKIRDEEEEDTKWDKFAKLKGIQKKKRTRNVWDDNSRKWLPRWGYKSKSNTNDKDWLIEVPNNANPYEDQFEKRSNIRSEKIAKNSFKQMKNIERTSTYKDKRQKLKSNLSVIAKSNASIGKYNEKPKNLNKHMKKSKGPREKIPIGNLKNEKEKLHNIVDNCGKSDVVFVIDSSASIEKSGRGNWNLVLDFINKIVDTFYIDTGTVRVAIVTFSNSANLNIALNSGYSKRELKRQIISLRHLSAWTNTYSALHLVRTKVFTELYGDRVDAENYLFILTDGMPTINVEEVDYEIELINKMDISIYAIGITNMVNEHFLKCLSSSPHLRDMNYFICPTFQDLESLVKSIPGICIGTTTSSAAITTTLDPINIPYTKYFLDCSNFIDLAFLIDSSHIVDESYWISILKFVNEIIDGFENFNNIRIGIIVFSQDAEVKVDLNSGLNKFEINLHILKLECQRSVFRNTYAAFRQARLSLFINRNGDRHNVPNHAILLTTGKPMDNDISELEKFFESGIILHLITVSPFQEDLKMFSSYPHYEYVNYYVWELPERNDNIIHYLSKMICLPSRTTTEMTTPIYGCKRKIDLAFVIDSPGYDIDKHSFKESIDNWDLILEFVIKIINQFNNFDNIHVAIIIFSYDAKIEIAFNSGYNKYQLIEKILILKFEGYETNTFSGLHLARTSLFTSHYGDRVHVDDYIIIITDGMPTVPQKLLSSEIAKIHGKNINVIAVGITQNINEKLLKELSSYPHQKWINYFTSTSFADLNVLQKYISEAICHVPKPITTTTQLPITTRQPECANEIDLAFVIDSSGSIRDNNPSDGSYDNWKLVLTFVNDIINIIDFSKFKIGVVVFSYDAIMEIPFNSGLNKEQLKKRILEIQFRNSYTNTYGGLNKARTELFTSGSGDRSNVDNYIIIITDGVPTINENLLENEILKVHENIKVFAVGITDNINVDLLTKLSSNPHIEGENYFRSTDFSHLNVIINQISKVTCHKPTVVNDGQCNTMIDLAFVLDASGSIGYESFEKTKYFVKSVVNDVVSLHQPNVRISLISYSTSAKLHFNFSDYYHQKYELLKYIDNLKSDFGTTNTADALKLLNQLFASKSTSRQVAIILTDGASDNHIETLKNVVLLKQSNVHLIVINIEYSLREDELKAMTSYPLHSNYIKVKHYNLLLNHKIQVIDLICKDQNECDQTNICNNGTCVNIIGGYICYCNDFYNGKNCEKDTLEDNVDLQIVIDRSGSRLFKQYYQDISMLYSLIENMAGGWKIGLGSYANDAIIHQNLTQNKKLLLNMINTITFTRGKTNLSGMLEVIKRKVYNNEYLNKFSKRKPIIIISNDGFCDNLDKTFFAAVSLRDGNVGIMTYGFLNKHDNPNGINDVWLAISTEPYSLNTVRIQENYLGVENEIVSRINYKNCHKSTCKWDYKCVESINSYKCQCNSHYIGKHCEIFSKSFDIIILIDVSGSISELYTRKVKYFFSNYLNKIFTSQSINSNIKVGIITFSDFAQIDISLGQYTTLQDLKFAIFHFVKHRGGKTNIAISLRMARNHFNGSINKNKLVVIFSDGTANIEKDHVKQEAEKLKEKAKVVCIGVGDLINFNVLANIAHGSNILTVYRILQLESLIDRLIEISTFNNAH